MPYCLVNRQLDLYHDQRVLLPKAGQTRKGLVQRNLGFLLHTNLHFDFCDALRSDQRHGSQLPPHPDHCSGPCHFNQYKIQLRNDLRTKQIQCRRRSRCQQRTKWRSETGESISSRQWDKNGVRSCKARMRLSMSAWKWSGRI